MSQEISKSKAPVAVLEYEPSAFEVALIKHKSKLILVGILAVVGTAGYWGYRLYREATHKSAAVAFTRAQTVEDLKKVATSYSGQSAAGNAVVLAAEQVSAERPAEAIEMLKGFLSSPLACLQTLTGRLSRPYRPSDAALPARPLEEGHSGISSPSFSRTKRTHG